MRQAALRSSEVNFRTADRSEYGLATGKLGVLAARLRQWEVDKGFGAGDWKQQAKRSYRRKLFDDDIAAKAAEHKAKKAADAIDYRKRKTPEQKAEAQRKKWAAQRAKRKEWTPEKRAEWKAKRAAYQRAWWEKLTPEQRAEVQARKNAATKKWRDKAA